MAETSISIDLRLKHDGGARCISGSTEGQGIKLDQAILLASAVDRVLESIGMLFDMFINVAALVRRHTTTVIEVDTLAAEAQETDQ